MQLWPLASVDGNRVHSEAESKHKDSLQFLIKKEDFRGKKIIQSQLNPQNFYLSHKAPLKTEGKLRNSCKPRRIF